MRKIALVLFLLNFTGPARLALAAPLFAAHGVGALRYETTKNSHVESRPFVVDDAGVDGEEHDAQSTPQQPASSNRHRHHWVGYVVIVGIVIGLTIALAAAAK